jgi:N4-(beta-N-acetylglucosaminyl)-L-asparaginase
MTTVDRRQFLAVSAGVTALAASGMAPKAVAGPGRTKPAGGPHPGDSHRGTCVISSGNGVRATEKAMQMLADGADPADAVVAGVNIVEDDPNDMSVGLGGLPNEDGVVELDASVMHGPLHRAGAVGALRNIKNPSSVALTILKRTDHLMLVGEGALRFARAHGFKEQDLLTERARQAWLRWKENLSPGDNWLNDDQRDLALAHANDPLPYTTGTINCLALTAGGDLAGTTSTSGLSYKLPGRVGDSPIIGAGLYVDNAIGAAGATGRGEAVIHVCGSFAVVQEMARGATPTEACLTVLRSIVDHTREKRLRNANGNPNFNVTFYALRKDGAYGSACLHAGGTFAVHDGAKNQTVASAALLPAE